MSNWWASPLHLANALEQAACNLNEDSDSRRAIAESFFRAGAPADAAPGPQKKDEGKVDDDDDEDDSETDLWRYGLPRVVAAPGAMTTGISAGVSGASADTGSSGDSDVSTAEWQQGPYSDVYANTFPPGKVLDMLLPCDSGKKVLSVGSLYHGNGFCRPCRFVWLPSGCKNGLSCNFCHACENHEGMGGGHRQQRPCKGKRDRYKKLVSKLLDEIASDPNHCDIDAMELPNSVKGNDRLHRKLRARLILHRDLMRIQAIPECKWWSAPPPCSIE